MAIFDYLFSQYSDYETLDIILEGIAVFFGLLSVWFARANKIWVYPTGIISTGIFVYLLNKWGLIGDMIINGYYFSMSVYGWYVWTRKVEGDQFTPISRTTRKEQWITLLIIVLSLICIPIVYKLFNKLDSIVAWIDTVTTAIFFAGMWLMARRKIENWIFWIIGDIISIPLYFYKGYTLTSFQYVVFLILAVWGYREWRRIMHERIAM